MAERSLGNMRKILCLLVLFGAFNASAQRFVRYFDTVTDMAASNPADPNVYVVVGGSVSFNDNQAARWKWVSGSVDPADGNTVVSTWAGGWPGKPAGRWKKINEASGIVIDTSGFITNYNVVVVNDKASLQNINVTNNIAVALVKGKYGMNDGWEGQFTFNAASTAVADDAFYVAPNTGVGMWERQTPNPLREIPATWFDPNLTNGVIQAAINYAASLSTNAVPGREVLLPPKFIEINGNTGLHMSNNVTLVGQNGTVLSASASTTAGYKMIYGEGVTNAGLKNLQLIGLASVSGYGIYLTNCNRFVWGGITFATNFTAAPVFISRDCSEIVPFDSKWVKNSIIAYGADPTGATDSTLPVKMALDNTAGYQSTNGGRIVWPNGYWSGNFVITNKNIVIDGEAGTIIDSTVSGCKITPWNTNLYTMVVGDDAPGGSVKDQQQGIVLNNLRFMDVGPNGQGIGNLHVKAGSYSVHMNDCTFFGGVSNSVLVSCSTNRETIYAIFTRCAMQGADNGEATFHVIGSSINTAVTILDNCRINGANTNGHGMVIDSEQVLCLGSTRLQCASNHGLQFLKTTAPSRTPQVIGKLNIDSNSSSDVLVEIPDSNPYPGAYLVEDIDVDGLYKLANGVILTNTSRSWHRQQSMNLDPLVWGNLFLQDSGTYTNTGPDYRNRLNGGGGGGIWQNDRGGIYLIPSTSLVLEQTNGLPTFNLLAIETKNLLTNEIIGVPNPGDTLTINGIVTTWASPVTDPTNQALIGADTGYSATNLYNHFVTYPMHGGGTWSLDFTAPNKVIHQAKYVDIVPTNTGTWVVHKVGAKIDNWTHSIYSGEATNLNVRAAGKLWIRDSAGNAVVELEETARPGLVYINTNGFGINRFPTAATLAVDGEVGRVIGPSISSAKTVTNSTPNTFGNTELSVSPTPLEPASGTLTNSAGIFHTLYAVGITSPVYTNNLTGTPAIAPIRAEISHHGSGTLTQTAGYYTGQPVVDGHGTINSHAGYLANINSVTNITLTIGVDVPIDGNQLVVNADTRTWRNVVGTPALEVKIGPTPSDSASNLVNHFVVYPISGPGNWHYSITDGGTGTFTNVVLRADGLNVATSITGTWATESLVTNKWPVYAFYGEGTADSRFDGYVGVGKAPEVAMDVYGEVVANLGFRQVNASGPSWTVGTGAPAMDAPIGSLYSDTAGGIGSTFYVKEVAGAGAGNWKAK